MGHASLLRTRPISLLLCILHLHHNPVLHEERKLPSALQVFQSQKASVRDLRPWLRQSQDNGAAAPAVLNFDSLHSLPAAVEASIKGATMKAWPVCAWTPAEAMTGCLQALRTCRMQ